MARMIQIADLIAELQELKAKWGNTCCYVYGLAWGAVALNMQADDEASAAWDGKYGAVRTEKGRFHRGEPVFILRAADPLAPASVESYAARCFNCGCDEEHIAAANQRANAMRDWQEKNPTLVKQLPDS
jgi:hypothetical protein